MIRTAAVGLVLAFSSITLTPSGEDQAVGIIRIFAVTKNTVSVDVGNPGPSAGDQRISGLILYDRHNRVIGNGYRQCTSYDRVLGQDVSFCKVIYSLPRGKILTEGTRSRRDYYVLPVLGGTRLYSNVQGTLIASTISFPPRRERLLFSLES
jgi:hypothetical protein